MNKLFRIGVAVLCLSILTACAPPGKMRRAEIGQPLSDQYLQIVSVKPDLVEVDAAGRTVRAAAPDGFCIPVDSIQTSKAAVFLVMGACGGNGGPDAGVVSLSITSGPMPGGLDELERFLNSETGLRGLGYGGDLEDLFLLGISRDEGALIALVQDRSEFGPAFADETICRAFMELNGRMAVLTILTPRTAPRSEAELQETIRTIMAGLARENA